MKKLTIEIHESDLGWIKAAEMIDLGDEQVRIEYDIDYAAEYFGRKDVMALSVSFPVGLDLYTGPMPGFMLDLIPQGVGLKRLCQKYQIHRENDYWSILATVPLASPGNLRIKEPWESIEESRPSYQLQGFTREEILRERHRFVDYMDQHGGPVGGTSGAAGGSLKFLLRLDHKNRFHADGYLDDSKTSQAIMVKFPFTDSQNAKDISRCEKSYYDVLRTFPLITGEAINIFDDTLFIVRFDRVRKAQGGLYYWGLESFYSAHKIHTYGARLSHEENIELIFQHSSDFKSDLLEYLMRDIINRALGNTDNHGRNTSFIKTNHSIRLSPIYDVTAMKYFESDPIVPSTHWDDEHRKVIPRLNWVAETYSFKRDELHQTLKALIPMIKNLERSLEKAAMPITLLEKTKEDRQTALAELMEIP